MYGSQAWVDPQLPYICLLFSGFSSVCHSAVFWPTALKLGCITNFDMLSLVMGFISLVNEIQFMLISSRHISNRSIIKSPATHNNARKKRARPDHRLIKLNLPSIPQAFMQGTLSILMVIPLSISPNVFVLLNKREK